MPSWVKNKYFLLAIVAICFVIIRIAIMSSSEILARQGEERYVGAVAQGIIDGWARIPWDFRAVEYVGGSIMNAFFSVPFFFIFGSCMGSLIGASILFQLIGLVCLFFMIEKNFGIRAAILCSCLYIIPPPLLMARSLIFNGAHEGSVVWGLILFYLFFKILDKKHLTLWYILLGLASGLSVWYACSNAIFVFAYMFLWFCYDHKFFLNKKYLLFCVSLFISLLPWLVFNSMSSSKGVRFPEYSFLIKNFSFNNLFFKKMWDLIFYKGYKIFIFDEFSLFYGNIFNVFYYVVFAIAFLALGYKAIFYFYKRLICHGKAVDGVLQERSRDRIFRQSSFLLVPCFFVLAYSASAHGFESFGFGIADYRYALLLFPFIFIIISLFLCMLIRSRFLILRSIGWLLYVTIILMSIIGNGKLVHSHDFKNNYLSTTACNFEVVGQAAFRRFGDDVLQAKRLIHILKENGQIIEAYRGYGQACVKEDGNISSIQKYIALSEKIESSRLKNDFLTGVGVALVECQFFPNISSLGNFFIRCDGNMFSEVTKYYIYSGMLNVLINRSRSQFSIDEIISVLPEDYRCLAYFRYGVKMGCYVYGKPSIKDCIRTAENIEKSCRQYYYNGVGSGIAYFYSGDLDKIIRQIELYPLFAQELLLQGVGMYFYYFANYCDKAKTESYFSCGFSKEHVEYFREGIEIFETEIDFYNANS